MLLKSYRGATKTAGNICMTVIAYHGPTYLSQHLLEKPKVKSRASLKSRITYCPVPKCHTRRQQTEILQHFRKKLV